MLSTKSFIFKSSVNDIEDDINKRILIVIFFIFLERETNINIDIISLVKSYMQTSLKKPSKYVMN